MNDVRERLEAIVWGAEVDPYSHALDVKHDCWRRGKCFDVSTREWAMEKSDEYQKRCSAMLKKCDMSHPGVCVLYGHYDKIKNRYWGVYEAFS
jgi:hypothetical protein